MSIEDIIQSLETYRNLNDMEKALEDLCGFYGEMPEDKCLKM